MKNMENEYLKRINHANPQNHVPDIEIKIQILNESYRATFHNSYARLNDLLPRSYLTGIYIECSDTTDVQSFFYNSFLPF
jgi:hypothetical protein